MVLKTYSLQGHSTKTDTIDIHCLSLVVNQSTKVEWTLNYDDDMMVELSITLGNVQFQ